jgi:hypothetical protein
MARHPGFFDASERLKALSAAGDPLVRPAEVVDFEQFRGELEIALARSDRAKDGRPPYDTLLMLKCWRYRRFTRCLTRRPNIS